jgi:hypothetical protein
MLLFKKILFPRFMFCKNSHILFDNHINNHIILPLHVLIDGQIQKERFQFSYSSAASHYLLRSLAFVEIQFHTLQLLLSSFIFIVHTLTTLIYYLYIPKCISHLSITLSTKNTLYYILSSLENKNIIN